MVVGALVVGGVIALGYRLRRRRRQGLGGQRRGQRLVEDPIYMADLGQRMKKEMREERMRKREEKKEGAKKEAEEPIYETID